MKLGALVVALMLFPGLLQAQSLFEGVARLVFVEDSSLYRDGQVVSVYSDGYGLSERAYDTSMIGVVTLSPDVVTSDVGAGDGVIPIVSSGVVDVLVSDENGAVTQGDLLTSSATRPGMAMKANVSGFVLGTALSDASSEGMAEVQVDLKRVNIESPITNWVGSVIPGASSIARLSLGLRWLIALVILVASLYIAWRIYREASDDSVTAVGRNPGASRAILTAVLVHTAIAILVSLLGIMAAFVFIVV